MLHEPADERVVHYLLRRMTEADRDDYEREYFSDQFAHERLLAVECELIDAYVGGELSRVERTDFERAYLATPDMRARVADARSFRAYLQNEQSPQPAGLHRAGIRRQLAASPSLAFARGWCIPPLPAAPPAIASVATAASVLIVVLVAVLAERALPGPREASQPKEVARAAAATRGVAALAQPTSTAAALLPGGPQRSDNVAAARPPVEPIRADGLNPFPTTIKGASPTYPPAARRAGVEGNVVIDLTIDQRGKVTAAKVLYAAHPLLVDTALKAVRQWQYTPAALRGVAVPTVMTVTVNFTLQ